MTSPATIKAVTFDVGGTLLQPHPSVGHVYSEVAARHGSTIAPDVLNRRFRNAWAQLDNFTHTREEWSALVDAVFKGIVSPPPSQTFFDELYNRFAERSAWHLFDDVIPAFEILASKGCPIGVISNWDERLRPLLDAFDLTNYFDAITVSCETAFPKPSPIIFEMASRKLGVAPGQILHIGDSPIHDDAGARSAGFQSLLLNRGLAEPGPGEIASLLRVAELPDLMGG